MAPAGGRTGLGILPSANECVIRNGRRPRDSKKFNFTHIFGSQAVGHKEVEEGSRLLNPIGHNLGHLDLDTLDLEPLDNPFGPRLSPMS